MTMTTTKNKKMAAAVTMIMMKIMMAITMIMMMMMILKKLRTINYSSNLHINVLSMKQCVFSNYQAHAPRGHVDWLTVAIRQFNQIGYTVAHRASRMQKLNKR